MLVVDSVGEQCFGLGESVAGDGWIHVVAVVVLFDLQSLCALSGIGLQLLV